MKSIESIIIGIIIISLSGCSSIPSAPKYSCWQYDGEPEWQPVKLDEELYNKLVGIVEDRYLNPGEDEIFINGSTKRKYNWYKSETDSYLACVVKNTFGYKVKLIHNNACFADRFILSRKEGQYKIEGPADGVICT